MDETSSPNLAPVCIVTSHIGVIQATDQFLEDVLKYYIMIWKDSDDGVFGRCGHTCTQICNTIHTYRHTKIHTTIVHTT